MTSTTPPPKHVLLPLGHEHLRTCFADAVNEEIRIMAKGPRMGKSTDDHRDSPRGLIT